jgi:hypothetical protein
MVFDLVAWVVILLAAGAVGRGALALLDASTLRPGDRFLLGAWIGVIVLAVGLLGTSLVAPLAPAVAAGTGAALAALGVLASMRPHALPPPPRVDRARLPTAIAASGIVLVLLGAAALASDPVTLYDSLVYHVGMIRWLREYGTVPGVALIHNRLGHVSAWFALAAPFDSGPGANRSANVPLGFALAIVGFQTALAVARIASRRATVSDWFLALASAALVWAAAGGNADSPSPDVVTNALIIITAWSLLVASGDSATDSARRRLVPFVIAVGACAMKLFAIPAAFAAGLSVLLAPSPTASGRVYARRVVACLAIGAAFLGPFVAANVVASGCPAFPSPLGCVDALPWSIGSAHAADYAIYVRDVARWERRGGTPVVGTIDWILPWILAHPWLTMLVVASPLLGLVLVRRTRSRGAPGSSHNDGAGVRAVVVLALAGIAFAALYAPAPRFLYSYVVMVPVLALAVAAHSTWHEGSQTPSATDQRRAATAFEIVSTVIGLGYAVASQTLNVRSAVASGAAVVPVRRSQLLVPMPPEVPARIFRWRVNDLDVFTPVPRPIADTLGYHSVIPHDAAFEKCSTAPLPCTPYLPESDVRLRHPNVGIAGGFVRAAPPELAGPVANCVAELTPLASSPTTWMKAPPAAGSRCDDVTR